MRTLLLFLASATATAYAQQGDVLDRASVLLHVSDTAVDRASQLVRDRAPRERLREIRVFQPYTVVISGTVISADGEILTAAVHPRAKLKIMALMRDGTSLEARVVGTDPHTNLALVRIDRKTPAFVPLAEIAVDDRQKLRIAGHAAEKPLRLDGFVTQRHQAVMMRDLYNVNLGRPLKIGSVFTVATRVGDPNPGSVCVDEQGRFCGVVLDDTPARVFQTQKDVRAQVLQFAFVLPSKRVLRIVDQLRKHGRVVRASYGVELLPVDAAVRAQFDLPASAAAVLKVEPRSAAAAAGLRANDVVVAVDGKTYANPYEMGDELAETKAPGSDVELTLLRSGKRVKLTVRPDER
ncbi:MAG: S1C family serine protease [Planctomycetota bacterium]|jgi:serine protease Do